LCLGIWSEWFWHNCIPRMFLGIGAERLQDVTFYNVEMKTTNLSLGKLKYLERYHLLPSQGIFQNIVVIISLYCFEMCEKFAFLTDSTFCKWSELVLHTLVYSVGHTHGLRTALCFHLWVSLVTVSTCYWIVIFPVVHNKLKKIWICP